jgi:hypothetical protein
MSLILFSFDYRSGRCGNDRNALRVDPSLANKGHVTACRWGPAQRNRGAAGVSQTVEKTDFAGLGKAQLRARRAVALYGPMSQH